MIIMKSYFLVKVIPNPTRGLQNMPIFWLCVRRKTHLKALMFDVKHQNMNHMIQNTNHPRHKMTSPMNFDGGNISPLPKSVFKQH